MSKKDSIIQAASKLFSEKGFKETSMLDVSRLSGAAEGTIFYHFKNKEDLLVSILETIKDEIVKDFESYIKDHTFANGLDMLEGAISFYLYLAVKMENSFLLLQRHYIYQLAEENPTCRNHLTSIYSCLVDIFEFAVKRGLDDGSIKDVSVRKVALIIFAMIDGLIRLRTYNLYDSGALYNEAIEICKNALRKT